MPGELADVATDQPAVADAADQRRGLAQRGQPPVGPIEVVLGQDVGHHEPVQRHPPGHQLADGRVAVLQPQVAGIQPGRLDGHVGLGDEVGVTAEHLEGGGLTGRVSVEGEDDLAAERVVVAHQPAQQPGVVVAERRAAGGDRRVDAGHVGGHHVGVALHDHGLGLLADLLPRQVQPVEHVGLLVERGLGGVQVLRRHPVVVAQPTRPEAEHLSPGVPDGPQQATLEVVPAGLADQPAGHQLGVAEAASVQVPAQRATVLRGVADPEVLRGRPVEAPLAEELATDAGLGPRQLLGVELRRRLVRLHQPQPLPALGLRRARRRCSAAGSRPGRRAARRSR